MKTELRSGGKGGIKLAEEINLYVQRHCEGEELKGQILLVYTEQEKNMGQNEDRERYGPTMGPLYIRV